MRQVIYKAIFWSTLNSVNWSNKRKQRQVIPWSTVFVILLKSELICLQANNIFMHCYRLKPFSIIHWELPMLVFLYFQMSGKAAISLLAIAVLLDACIAQDLR